MTENIIEYLVEQLKESYTTLAWQKGMFCLRCDPKGVPCIETESREGPWCPLCGKDPLFYGPLLMDRVFFKYTAVQNNEVDVGGDLARRIQHQLYQEVFHGGRTSTPPRRSSEELEQR